MEWMRTLFKEYPPTEIVMKGDNLALTLNELGGGIMAFGFLVLGILCLRMAGTIHPPSFNRSTLTKLFGWFLISAAITRGFDVLAYWHNYAMLRGVLKIISGGFSLGAIVLLPTVVKEILRYKNLMDIEGKLKKTQDKLKAVKEISNKLDK